jgi:hypothetical protein
MSPKKHAAQIANSIRSTGPRTEDGKAKSSRNSTRHGFCSEHYVVAANDRDLFDRFYAEMIEALAPEGVIEMQLAEAIVTDQFRIMRIKNAENEIFAEGFGKSKTDFLAHGETWSARHKELATLSLYEQRIFRNLTRNKQELEARQSARREVAQASATVHPEPLQDAESKPELAVLPSRGFVHSTAPAAPSKSQPAPAPCLAEPPNPASEATLAA